MTVLQIMDDTAEVLLRTEDAAVIETELAKRNVAFSRWPGMTKINPATTAYQILDHYQDKIDELNSDNRFKHIDVAFFRLADRYWRDAAKIARGKFLPEHRHTEDEVRFFAAGSACFYLHIDSEVLAVVCKMGDLLSIPAGVRHWFDMGEHPNFSSIRFFENEDGWIGDFTGDEISSRFPTFDELSG